MYDIKVIDLFFYIYINELMDIYRQNRRLESS